MKIAIKPYMIMLLILLYGLIFLLPFAGSTHLFDWDEIIFAEAAREMIVSGNYLTVTINYAPFWEKPPGFIWMQVISMKLFGINEFAARFPNVLSGIITLIFIYLAGRKLHGDRFGMLWTLSFGTAILPFFYFRTGIIDPWFNLFIFMGFTFFIFYLAHERFKRRHLNVGLSAFFLGLAVLTKGPVAVLIFAISFFVYLLWVRGRISVRFYHVALFMFVLIVTGGSWFLVAVLSGNMQVVADFIQYQAGLFSSEFAGHGGFPGFHFVILLFGVFPASVLMLKGFPRKKEEEGVAQMFRTWMYILLFLVLILFTIVRTKLVHYSSLAYYPTTFIAAWVMHNWLERRVEIGRWQIALLGVVGALLVLMTFLVPMLLQFPDAIAERFAERMSPYTAGLLGTEAGWGITAYIPSVILLAGLIFSLGRISRRDRRGLYILHSAVALFTYASILLFVPKIERMVQQPAINFIKSHAGPDERVVNLGSRSFAPYFYGKWMPGDMPPGIGVDLQEVFKEKEPVYVVMRADRSEKVFAKYPGLVRLGAEGGFVFAVWR
jgi:hypothetical protein